MYTDCGDSESGINKCREGLERKTLGEKEKTLLCIVQQHVQCPQNIFVDSNI